MSVVRWLTITPTIVLLLHGCIELDQDQSAIISRDERSGDGAALEISYPDRSVEVGESIPIGATVTAPAESGPTIRLQLAENGPFMLRGDSDTDMHFEDGRVRMTRHFALYCLQPGRHELPAVEVTFTDGEPMVSKPSMIQVESLLAGEFDPGRFEDIRTAVSLDEPDHVGTIIIVAGFTAIAAIGVIVFLVARRPRPATEPTPHEWAHEQLNRIESENLPEQGKVHEFYTWLSDVIRHYMERRFGIAAPEQTTDEFMAIARTQQMLDEQQKRMLGRFLAAADRVKFAGNRPGASECDLAMDEARNFIDTTMPVDIADDGTTPPGSHDQQDGPTATRTLEGLA